MPPSSPGSRRETAWSGRGWLARLRLFFARRQRTLIFLVPLHLAAFLVLYLASVRLVESEVESIAVSGARRQLDLVAQELSEVAVAHTRGRAINHFFAALLASHKEIHLKLLLPDGRALGPESTIVEAEHDALRSLLPSPELQRIWLGNEGSSRRLRGLKKVVATSHCARCHPAGQTLAVASMAIDLSATLQAVRERSRRNLALLILAWAAALGGTTALVRISVKRSAAKLEAELEAAANGASTGAESPSQLVLDPAAAELHRSLRDFLRRQRQRQVEVASRLAHSDQLASLGQLAAGLAHEIKNPLAGIQGALEILREDRSESDANKELFAEMLGELKRVNETLQTLLASSRPSPPRLAATDMRQLLEDVHRLMEPSLRRQRVTLQLKIATGSLVARVDPAKLRQVLINLIQNAAEAMSDGGRITLRGGGFPQIGSGVILAVQDDGPGISAENLKKIFEPFFTTKFGGTGLGLAIARSHIEAHGGSLEVQSELGKGSTFYILLQSLGDQQHIAGGVRTASSD